MSGSVALRRRGPAPMGGGMLLLGVSAYAAVLGIAGHVAGTVVFVGGRWRPPTR